MQSFELFKIFVVFGFCFVLLNKLMFKWQFDELN